MKKGVVWILSISCGLLAVFAAVALIAESGRPAVVFNAGGETARVMRVDKSAQVTPPDEPVMDGYVFKYWAQKGTNTPFDFQTPITEKIELVAVWETVLYTIEYLNSFDAVNTYNRTAFTVRTPTFELLPVDREGYDFGGWYTAESGGEPLAIIPKGTMGNIKLYAKWLPPQKTLTLYADGELEEIYAELQKRAGETVSAAELPDPERMNYIFNGWYYDSEYRHQVTGSFDANDMELYAKWTPEEYSIRYSAGGGTYFNPDSYNTESGDIVLSPAELEGYEFIGWRGENGDIAAVIEGGSGGNRTYTAEYERKSYFLTYDLGEGILLTVSKYYGADISEDAPMLEKTGYTLEYWGENGVWARYMPARDLTVAPVWKLNTYTLTVLIEAVREEYSLSYGTVLDSVLARPSMRGFTFKGWFAESGEVRAMPEFDITVAARFTPQSFRVIFCADALVPNGGQSAGFLEFDCKSIVTLPRPIDGENFYAWAYDDEGFNIVPVFFEMPAQDLLLYPVYKSAETPVWIQTVIAVVPAVPETPAQAAPVPAVTAAEAAVIGITPPREYISKPFYSEEEKAEILNKYRILTFYRKEDDDEALYYFVYNICMKLASKDAASEKLYDIRPTEQSGRQQSAIKNTP